MKNMFILVKDEDIFKQMQEDLTQIKKALQIETPQRKDYYSVREVTDLMGWSRSTFNRWIKSYDIPYTKVMGRILVHTSEIEKLLKTKKR